MRTNIFSGSIISIPTMWVHAGAVFWTEIGKHIGNVIVTISDNDTTTTYNAEVIITDEIDKHHSGIPVSS